jgi:hypothetical protein
MPADPTPPRSSRRRWTGRNSSLSGFCAGARFCRIAPGGQRSVGLREPPRPRGRGSWPLACQIQRALAPCTSEGQQIVKDGRKAAGEGGWECLSTRAICHASTAVMLVLVSAVAAHLLPSTLPAWARGHAAVLSAGAGRSRTRSALRLLVTRVRSRVWQRGDRGWLAGSGVSCLGVGLR